MIQVYRKTGSVIAAVALLTGCGGGGGAGEAENSGTSVDVGTRSPSPAATTVAATGIGSFVGTVGDKTYEVEVSCADIDKDYFRFNSDQTDITDSNGDGLVISGMQAGSSLVLTIIDNGKNYSTAGLASFDKSNSGASGTGTVFEEETSAAFAAEFSVDCD